MKDALAGHEERVTWQLHRIYRARNNLVHAGRRPSFLDSLVLNLEEYYLACFGTLINRASRQEEEADIDQLIAEIGIKYSIYSRYLGGLRKEQALSKEAFLRAVA